MKRLLLMVLTILSIFISSASSCSKNDDPIKPGDNDMTTNGKIRIKVGAKVFTATLLDNHSAKAFKAMLPLTLDMIELNGNEKYYNLPNALPTNSSNPETIKSGDLMLYGSKTLVLFYKSFSTSYSYTKLGSIDNVTDLEGALGTGNVIVSFEL